MNLRRAPGQKSANERIRRSAPTVSSRDNALDVNANNNKPAEPEAYEPALPRPPASKAASRIADRIRKSSVAQRSANDLFASVPEQLSV